MSKEADLKPSDIYIEISTKKRLDGSVDIHFDFCHRRTSEAVPIDKLECVSSYKENFPATYNGHWFEVEYYFNEQLIGLNMELLKTLMEDDDSMMVIH